MNDCYFAMTVTLIHVSVCGRVCPCTGSESGTELVSQRKGGCSVCPARGGKGGEEAVGQKEGPVVSCGSEKKSVRGTGSASAPTGGRIAGRSQDMHFTSERL